MNWTNLSDGKIPEKATKLNLGILFLAHAFVGAQLGLYFVISGLAGQMLAENKCFSTLPITMIVIGSMISAPFLAQINHHFNRKISFLYGVCGGFIGCLLCIVGLFWGSFTIFLVGSLFHGMYMAAQAFFRFAAAEVVNEKYKAYAISFVMVAGLFAAIIGPQTAKLTMLLIPNIPFTGGYIAAIIMNIFGGVLFMFFTSSQSQEIKKTKLNIKNLNIILQNKDTISAIICATIAYALMNLVMTSTPLAVIGCGFSSYDAANIVTAHALSMYLPSFFTGSLISKYGVRTVMTIGTFLLAISGLFGILGIEITNFYADLIFLGVGWNFLFIGSTYLLTTTCDDENKNFIQGVNDFCVFGTVALASLSSGFILNCSGTSAEIGWTLVNLSMFPFIAVSAILIIFLKSRPIRI